MSSKNSQIAELIATLTKTLNSDSTTTIQLPFLTTSLEELVRRLEFHEQAGLHDICSLLLENILDLHTGHATLSSEQHTILKRFFDSLQNYLQHTDQQSAEILLQTLQADCWPSPVATENIDTILSMLTTVAKTTPVAASAPTELQIDETQVPDTQQIAEMQVPDTQEIAKTQVLDTQDIAEAQALGTQDMVKTQVLGTQDIAETQALDTQEIAKTQVLDTQDIAEAQALGTQDMVKTQVLGTQDIAETQALDTQEIAKTQVLDTQDIAEAQALGTQDMVKTQVLGTQDITETQALDTQDIAETQALDTQEIAKTQVLDTQEIAKTQVLGTQDMVKTQVLGTQDIAETQALDTQEIAKTQVLGTQDMVKTQVLGTQDIAETQALDTQEIAKTQVLDTQEIAKTQVLGTQDMVKTQVLGTQDIAETQALDTQEIAKTQVLGTQQIAETQVLDTLIANIDAGDAERLPALVDEIENIGERFGERGLVGLQDICSFVHENINDLLVDRQKPNETQMALLKSWCQSLGGYCNTPEDPEKAQALLDNITDSNWPSAMEKSHTVIIGEMLGIKLSVPKVSDESSLSVNDERVDATPRHADNTQGALLEQIRQTIFALKADDVAQIKALIQQIETFCECLDEELLMALHDLCLSLSQNLADIHAEGAALSALQHQHLRVWTDLVQDYLQQPESSSYLEPLITLMKDTCWPVALSDEDGAVLLGMMGKAVSDDVGERPVEESSEDITSVLGDEVDMKELPQSKKLVDIPAPPKPVNPSLVDMLLSEARKMTADNQMLVNIMHDPTTDRDTLEDVLAQYISRIERFGGACQAAELDGLYQANNYLRENLLLMKENNQEIPDEIIALLRIWPEKMSAYLSKLGSLETSTPLVDALKLGYLLEPLMEEVSPALLDLLNAPYLSDVTATKELRLTKAGLVEVSLALPDDINQELLDGLLQELPGQTETFSQAIQSLIAGVGNISDVEKAQRTAHTIKGAANTVGIKGIAVLTHQLEDILAILNTHKKMPSQKLGETLMEAADCLEEMCEALMSQSEAPANAVATLQAVLDWANRLDTEGVDILDDGALDTASTKTDKAEATAPTADEQGQSQSEQTLRVPARLIDDLLRLLGETVIVNAQLKEKTKISSEQCTSLLANNNALKDLVNNLEKQLEVSNMAHSTKIAVNQDHGFDSLELEQYSELHSLCHQITEMTTDSHEFNLNVKTELETIDELLISQARLNREVHEMVMGSRMIPIKNITPRLQRSVRQTCRTTNKRAELIMHGKETHIDSEILSNLIDPLMHIIRNAVDHGIETPAERTALGKPETGRLTLSCAKEGMLISICCEDDGKGLDKEKIRTLAKQRGLLDNTEQLNDEELYRLILKPGFSTRSEVTHTSGRGVGMDVVTTQLRTLKGSVHIDSVAGEGSKIELRIPATLMSTQAVLVRSRQQVLAISGHGVERILHPDDTQSDKKDDDKYLVDGEVFAVDALETLLNLPFDRRHSERNEAEALLIRDGDLKHVVFVQEIIMSTDVVIKSMGKYLKRVRGIVGATILGDGSVVPVVDLPELFRMPEDQKVTDSGDAVLGDKERVKALPFVLVVDDSLSARKSLELVVKDAGYQVRTAKDGLEALAIIEKKPPDILLLDLEMPRMNGLELTSHIRGTDSIKDTPIIMVTSRTADKHRQIAKDIGVNSYMPKPFKEDDMLDQMAKFLAMQDHEMADNDDVRT